MRMVILLMYQLRKNTTSYFINDSDQKEEKIGKNLYLKKSHFHFLDSRAEEKGVSRNQALRDILDSIMEDDERLEERLID